MSGVVAYSYVVNAVVSPEAWDEVYFSLLSLKAHLQSLPGWQRFDFWAQNKQNGAIKLLVITNWNYAEQLEVWLRQGTTVDQILRQCDPPPQEMSAELYEEIG